ncbi:lysine transporter LysE [Rhodospirillum rubrum]|nr:lysine transporter LysE [Rhodospirillum rubrum]MBK1676876.1 lysine transporter LysE [Rhodospirillum rubrum]
MIKGMAVGLAIAAPVGPVGVLCIRKALADGRLAAFVAGMGAAVADTFYGAVAGLGLGLISDFLTQNKNALSVVGGLFLLVLGVRTLRRPPLVLPATSSRIGLLKDFLSTFTITMTNPATILAFMAVFASFSLAGFDRDKVDASLVILGVFLGSSLWWATLAAAAGAVRSHFTPLWLDWLNKMSGGLLLIFGVAVLAMLVFG